MLQHSSNPQLPSTSVIMQHSSNPQLPSTSAMLQHSSNPQLPSTSAMLQHSSNPHQLPSTSAMLQHSSNPQLPSTSAMLQHSSNPQLPSTSAMLQHSSNPHQLPSTSAMLQHSSNPHQLPSTSVIMQSPGCPFYIGNDLTSLYTDYDKGLHGQPAKREMERLHGFKWRTGHKQQWSVSLKILRFVEDVAAAHHPPISGLQAVEKIKMFGKDISTRNKLHDWITHHGASWLSSLHSPSRAVPSQLTAAGSGGGRAVPTLDFDQIQPAHQLTAAGSGGGRAVPTLDFDQIQPAHQLTAAGSGGGRAVPTLDFDQNQPAHQLTAAGSGGGRAQDMFGWGVNAGHVSTKRKRNKHDNCKPPSAYMLFCGDTRAHTSREHPHMSPQEIASEQGRRWNTLEAHVKAWYKNKYASLLADYLKSKNASQASQSQVC
ncbi:hypothetical protein CEUSTIGMA_g2182.t1 [Chlamydomonas eustigma]|uniref:HMG box domain-containing protein n=1 Tax=Chlamydomonas eustigma TaxID=1157962 RepID=A0A250WVA3_9CHLO|nr:hypothetical protein CEUSTIGMA_g2182.t1 [Chlamydomonas eustigma]|eukprot:GAX74735.1 hypothetical protein CEUSTIGMA_g2182.t1 [Chlamydomonas eustigma]